MMGADAPAHTGIDPGILGSLPTSQVLTIRKRGRGNDGVVPLSAQWCLSRCPGTAPAIPDSGTRWLIKGCHNMLREGTIVWGYSVLLAPCSRPHVWEH
jgi:hypothetical protein